MRKVVFVAFVAWVTATTWAQAGKEAKLETLLRWNFAGTKQLATIKDLKTFNEVLASPETHALRDAAARTFGDAAAARFVRGGDTNAAAGISSLIQPLFPDFVQNESRFQMNASGAEDAGWILAIKLTRTRSQEWSKKLAQLASTAGMKGASGEKNEWTATRDRYKVSFSRSRDWTIIEGGFGAPDPSVAKEFRAALGKRLGKRALDAEVNTPLLGKIWGAPQLAHFPKLTLQAEPKRDGFHSELLVDYPVDLGIKPEKWNVPAGIIRDPLIGFTAVQGIQKKLAAYDRFRALGAQETPNQLFIWAQSLSPFSVTLAAEVKNPAQVVTNAAKAFKNATLPSGDLFLPTNRVALVWRGLPVIVPFIQAAAEPHQSFLTAGFFPIETLAPDPAPAELLAQLNQKNLVYYDWEITGDRLEQWIPLWQLYYLLGNKLGPENTSPSSTWVQSLRFRIGNTVTEATLQNARQLKIVRQSPLGLNALELVLFSHWLDSGDLRPMPAGQTQRGAQPNLPAPLTP